MEEIRAHASIGRMAVHETALLPGNVGKILDDRSINVHTLTVGGGYVWAGFSIRPSLLIRMDPDSLEYEKIQIPDTGGLHCLCYDGRYLWISHSSGHLTRFDPLYGSHETIELWVRGRSEVLRVKVFDYVFTSAFDLIWIGVYNDPGRLLAVDKETGEYEEVALPDTPSHSVRSLCFDGQSIWVSIYSSPASLIEVHATTGEVRQVIRLEPSLILGDPLAFDGQHIWQGFDTMPAKVVRVDRESGLYTSHSLHPLSSCVRALAYDGSSLWIGLYTRPAEIARLNPETKDFVIYRLPKDFRYVRALDWDGKYVWVALQNLRSGPSGIYRILPEGES